METCLVVNDGHVVVSELLKRICQVGVRLRHAGVENDAAIVESNALLMISQLVVDGPDQQK